MCAEHAHVGVTNVPLPASRVGPALALTALALASLTVLSRADAALGPRREHAAASDKPTVRSAPSAAGLSRGVRVRTALPGARVSFPLEVSASPDSLGYAWVALGQLESEHTPRPLAGPLVAPTLPGFYRLTLVSGGRTQVVDGTVLGVMRPISDKRGGTLNGYQIGWYKGERTGVGGVPVGFLEVRQEESELRISEHLTLADFLTHDAQTSWPRYVALNPTLLDKLELVFEEIAAWQGRAGRGIGDVDVTSGFRTPLHNRRVPRAAGDSRHQYGDAADIAVDANGDGRVTAHDVGLINRAVEAVERTHPSLVGGLGLYTRNGAPYAHIDVRGKRVRWRG